MTTTLTSTGVTFNDGTATTTSIPLANTLWGCVPCCLRTTLPIINQGSPYYGFMYGTFYTTAASNLWFGNINVSGFPDEIKSNGSFSFPYASNASGSWRSCGYAAVYGYYDGFFSNYVWPCIPYYRYA